MAAYFVRTKGRFNMTQGLTSLGSGRSITWAVLLIVFGCLAIALPLGTSLGVVIIVAWLITLSGGFQFIHAFQSQGAGSIAWKLLVAVLYLIVGLYFVTHPLMGLASFTLALAFFFLAEGVFDIVAYFQSRGVSGSTWMLLDGIVTLILGGLVWKHWPSSSAWVIGTLVGISMIMTGTTRLMISLAVRRLRQGREGGEIRPRMAA
jgi:uncharacterized membrane protein HdeD (DUF308 family)